jgi:two-component system LytT family sensor kinase
MAIKFHSRYTSTLLHVVIWSILFVLPHLFFDTRNTKPDFFPGSFFIITNLYHVGLFYLNAFVLYSLFFNKRKWWIYILMIGLMLIASYYLKLFIVKQWYSEVVLDAWAYRILFFPAIPFLVVSIIYRLIVDKIAYDKKQKEIVAEQLSIKLKFLRSQINPHFIFNILTNLVSLARKRSEKLEPALIMLSDLMRYMLYESDEKKVILLKEVEYLKSYIELQKLRFGHDVAIETNIDLSKSDERRSIEPMLLIPFVENAFKHGIGVDKPLILVYLTADNGKIEFDVKNKYSDCINESKDVSSGIGLKNIQSRLMLLYPNEHILKLEKENNLFHVHLTLQLK